MLHEALSRRKVIQGLGATLLLTPSPRSFAVSARTVDYAQSRWRAKWLSHPIFGDPSWDSFERRPGGAVVRGTGGRKWPVNAFFFKDPVSGNWYIYVGNYAENYAIQPGVEYCTVLRSIDLGKTWESLGEIFPKRPFVFDGGGAPVGGAPDVSVVYEDGRYHLVCDWFAANDLTEPTATYFDPALWKHGEDAGIAYAWSERPEGPFHRQSRPLLSDSKYSQDPLLGKYNYFYGATLLRRKHDWMILSAVYASEYRSWGLVALSATSPEGPYGAAEILFVTDLDEYHPPCLEYFPAFTHDGWVYAPATSVSQNRSFQLIRRAPLEKAMDRGAWEIFQHGSVWHDEPVEDEAAGLWGQTFSGFVDKQNRFQVVFPSKDSQDTGTLSLASRPWDEPYADRGFHLSAPQSPSLTFVRHFYHDFLLELDLELTGVLTLFWGYSSPLGTAPKADTLLHPLMTQFPLSFEVHENGWQVRAHSEATPTLLAEGELTGAKMRHLSVEHLLDGTVRVVLDGVAVWSDRRKCLPGAIGLMAHKGASARVPKFSVRGEAKAGTFPMIYTIALLGAGQKVGRGGWHDWQEVTSPLFHFGIGAVALSPESGRAKWDFRGTGFAVWAPKGPKFGLVSVVVDGQQGGMMNLYQPTDMASAVILELNGLADTFHAVTLHAVTGCLVVDSIDVHV